MLQLSNVKCELLATCRRRSAEQSDAASCRCSGCQIVTARSGPAIPDHLQSRTNTSTRIAAFDHTKQDLAEQKKTSPSGFEPETFGFGGRRAVQLCHGDHVRLHRSIVEECAAQPNRPCADRRRTGRRLAVSAFGAVARTSESTSSTAQQLRLVERAVNARVASGAAAYRTLLDGFSPNTIYLRSSGINGIRPASRRQAG